ncbi:MULTISPECIES: acetyl-CoA carboxylase [Streptomyces]|uniref:Biotin carboxyl carrier protein of acetyl-CoA carboxylase n=1 Tax=Streptomyces heilongjiangensis TaxID=945052 RepID=A0ABW1BAF2_9ACTN|nr:MULTISPECIES: acetyl-CoA carboxylase [Streptomyces]MDC2951160.1 acetyl-CoA carboxylase [Streptomyces heilongjiangensis]
MSEEKTVAAPFPGVFYRRPDPESPPFVNVGDVVEAGTVVGLIEVMKMFQEIQAGASGHVTAVLVENEQAVDAGQTLLTVE